MIVDSLAEALTVHPASTARQLAELVRSNGVTLDERAVTRVLYAAHGRFRCDGGDPARWFVAQPAGTLPAPPPISPPRSGTGADSASPQLYRWQSAALAAWSRQRQRGVVEAVTGAGKTIVGVAAVLAQRRTRGQAVVLVPTKELQHQWLAVLRRWCDPSKTLVGALGDGCRATLATHDVVVGVVNSVRDSDLRPTRPGGLLVADECHRYGSAMNRLALDQRMTRRLGLSATYERDDDGHLDWLDPYFGGTCYTLGYSEAVADGVVAEPVVALIGVALDDGERATYDEYTDAIGKLAAVLIGRHGVTRHPYSAFMREINALADRRGDCDAAHAARGYRHAVLERRRLLADAQGKRHRLVDLVPVVSTATRTLVFTQSIATSEAVAAQLAYRRVAAGAVHSGLSTDVRRSLLRQFAAGDVRVLAAPRVLDEGIDVPAADLAVIVGASRSRRQMVQRMGRVLRVKDDGRSARFAILYAEGTVEDPRYGAHEGFLREVTSIAVAVRNFPSTEPASDITMYLDHAARSGALAV